MRDRSWRRQQKRNKKHKTPVGCSCMMCSPGRYGFAKHTDVKKTVERIRDLEAKYLEEKNEQEGA